MEDFPVDIQEDEYGLVSGALLNQMIRQIIANQISPGPGIRMEAGSTGAVISADIASVSSLSRNFAVITGLGSEVGQYTAEQVALQYDKQAAPEVQNLVWLRTGVVYDGNDLPELTSTVPVKIGCNGALVEVIDSYSASGNTITLAPTFRHPIPPRSIFPVQLVEDGNGGAGDEATQCDFTYDVFESDGGAQIATGVDPAATGNYHTRPSVGTMTAATQGMAYYVTNGNLADNSWLVIAQCNEYLDFEACS